MGYGAFYVICPRASSQYVTPLVTSGGRLQTKLFSARSTRSILLHPTLKMVAPPVIAIVSWVHLLYSNYWPQKFWRKKLAILPIGIVWLRVPVRLSIRYLEKKKRLNHRAPYACLWTLKVFSRSSLMHFRFNVAVMAGHWKYGVEEGIPFPLRLRLQRLWHSPENFSIFSQNCTYYVQYGQWFDHCTLLRHIKTNF